jgi:fructose-1,6-bisphosphatase/sedoheptulose 1,7-bisphosphatase-like protein
MVDVTDIKSRKLEKKGWVRRSILDEPRLSEVVMMYKEMGLEVMVIDMDPDIADGCKTCVMGHKGKLKVVYTRKKKKSM